MQRSFILIFLFISILCSCDPGYSARIINRSNSMSQVIVEYDRELIQKDFERNVGFNPEVVYNNENSKTLIKIDTIDFVVTCVVQPSDTLLLEMGIGTRPEFNGITRVTIIADDTLYLENKKKMKSIFSKRDYYQYEFMIE